MEILSNTNLKFGIFLYVLFSVFSQRNWNSQQLFPFVICLILIVSSSSRYWEQEMIVTIFMSTMESLSAILHVKYRFNVFSIYGRYTHNYSVSFCNFKLTIIFVNAVEIYHTCISWMFTISLVLLMYTVYTYIPTLRNRRCLHHLFVVGIVEPRLCPKWYLSLHLLQNINH